MSDDDWLALEPAAVVEQARAPVAAPPAAGKNLAQKAAPASLPARRDRSEFAKAWRKLTPRQRRYLESLVRFGFNKTKALKALEMSGEKLVRHTPMRWGWKDEGYRLCLETLKKTALGDAVEPGNMLLAADHILELALAGTPKFDREGNAHYEPQLDTALRANEQKMKATGMLRGEVQNTRVTVRIVNLAGPQDDAIDAEHEVIDDE